MSHDANELLGPRVELLDQEGPGADAAHHEDHTIHNGLTGFSWVDRALGLAEGGLAAAPALEHALHHSVPGLVPGMGALFGPLGFLAGGAETIMGGYEALTQSDPGRSAGGLISALQGVTGMVGGGASTLGALSTSAGGEAVLGVTAASAAPVAAVASAAGIGLGTGKLLGDSLEGKTFDGMFGTDDFGHERDAMGQAADWGLAAESWMQSGIGATEGSGSFGDLAGGALGGTVAALGGIGNGLRGAEGLIASLFQ